MHRLAGLLRRVDRPVDELPVRRRTVRLAADEVVGRAVVGYCGEGHDQVAELVVRLQPAAGPDPQQLLDAELDQLLEHDRRTRAAHARSLNRDRLAFVCTGVPQQTALRVSLLDVVEVRLGDVLRAKRITGKEASLRVLPRLGSNVDRHEGQP